MSLESLHTIYGFDIQMERDSVLHQAIKQNGFHEKAESEMVLQLIHPGDFCIDAGCHAGYFSLLMLSKGAEVLSIDANPEMCKLAEINLAPYSHHVMNVALGNRTGHVEFYLVDHPNEGMSSVGRVSDRHILADMVRLQDLPMPDRVRMLKLDVEGSEVQALLGAGDLLKRIDYILMECQSCRLVTLNDGLHGVTSILSGWEVWEPDAHGSWNQLPEARDSYNILFINPIAIERARKESENQVVEAAQ